MTPLYAVQPRFYERDTGARAWVFDAARASGPLTALQPELKPLVESMIGSFLVYMPRPGAAWPLVSQVTVTRLLAKPPQRPDATHDITVLNLNPDQTVMVDSRNSAIDHVPFVGVFAARDDEDARDTLVRAVKDLMAGRLSGDPDRWRGWAQVFGGEVYEAMLAQAKRRDEDRIAQIQAALGLLDDAPKGEVTPGCDCPYCTANRYTQ